MKTIVRIITYPAFALFAFACFALSPTAQADVSVFATGLNNPRGLKFGPDGNLYVAEGGAAASKLSA